MYYARYESPVGQLLLTCDGQALTGLWMNRATPEEGTEGHPILEQTAKWLDGYFAGIPQELEIPLAARGTPFQEAVWKLLLEIPFGETRTYGALARVLAAQMGKARMSAQAVGGAVGANPISILIPCHRVVGAGGKLTGYAGGLEKKQWLLTHEANL